MLFFEWYACLKLAWLDKGIEFRSTDCIGERSHHYTTAAAHFSVFFVWYSNSFATMCALQFLVSPFPFENWIQHICLPSIQPFFFPGSFHSAQIRKVPSSCQSLFHRNACISWSSCLFWFCCSYCFHHFIANNIISFLHHINFLICKE